MEFRFSPHPNRADQIHWRSWSEGAFAEALAADRPVLLSISAVWCHWCHVMDETTFSDERVIKRLNEAFIPMRVDNDRRPDINRRYNMGGWPTVAFLTPEAEVLTGATYVPPDQFLGVLDRIGGVWRDRRGELRGEVEALRGRLAEQDDSPPPNGPVSEDVVDRVLTAVQAGFDAQHGGFGSAMKFPRADILSALVTETETRHDHEVPARMLRETLDAMSQGGLWDAVELGFFRYATQADWSEPHYEKMLEDNAHLIRVYARAGVVLDRPDYLRVAEQAQAYVDVHLWRPEAGAYGGSQDADEAYYALATPPERAAHGAPYVDPMTYTDWNALEIQALVGLNAATGDPSALERALHVAGTLLDRRSERGLFRHDPLPDALDGLLGDQLAMLEASVALHQATGNTRWLDEAGDIRLSLMRHFTMDTGPLLADVAPPTTPADDPATASPAGSPSLGRRHRADAPQPENARFAAVLATLARITRDDSPAAQAREIIGALSPFTESIGDFGAEIARATIVTLREPLHVTIVGRSGAGDTVALLDEAVRIRRAHKVIEILDPDTDGEKMAAAGFSGGRAGAQAYVCVEGTCLEPVTTPDDLADLADGVLG
jgi:uncharacterized protein YyaL (SSP411 family)